MSLRTGPFTGSQPARVWLRDVLMPYGIGLRQAAKLAGEPEWVLDMLLYGRPARGRLPTPLIPVATADAILAVRPVPANLAGGAFVNRAGTCRRVQALTRAGWSMRAQAAGVGTDPSHLRAIVRGTVPTITADVARAVAAVYDELWDTPPPQTTTPERISAAKARAYAEAQGWAPALAWDDDTIDDPAATPAEGWQRTERTWRSEDLVAEVTDLARFGYDRAQAAERLSATVRPTSRDAIQKAVSRTKGRAA